MKSRQQLKKQGTIGTVIGITGAVIVLSNYVYWHFINKDLFSGTDEQYASARKKSIAIATTGLLVMGIGAGINMITISQYKTAIADRAQKIASLDEQIAKKKSSVK